MSEGNEKSWHDRMIEKIKESKDQDRKDTLENAVASIVYKYYTHADHAMVKDLVKFIEKREKPDPSQLQSAH